MLRKFWEIEEIPGEIPLSAEDEKCERHFVETHSRTPEGRYVVRLPIRDGQRVKILDSLYPAKLLWTNLEKRLSTKPDFHFSKAYREFLDEYEELGHMEEVSSNSSTPMVPVYIPHHPIMRESSSTTKIRVVFNASYKFKGGKSLNDYLLVGLKLQADITAVISRWRFFQYVYTADIAKMFRQIRIHSADADLQRIVWRSDPESDVKHFRLLTVTYGTASAPFLAMRVLRQLGEDEGATFPAAASILKESIYVDDVLFGADDVPALLVLRDQLNGIMAKGGFHLRKWASNCDELLAGLPPEDCERTLGHSILEEDPVKVLGIAWYPREDIFRYQVAPMKLPTKIKRSVLSLIAKLFDPLGWVSPVVIVAKIFMQELWLKQSDWDEELDGELLLKWSSYCAGFVELKHLRIPRWVRTSSEHLGLELHGFADASHRAYAAVVYLHVLLEDEVKISLIIAKSKVAPVRTVSVPRLELNAAVLLARLLEWAQKTLSLANVPIYGWTDSTVTLAWLREHPSKWNIYVANRVSDVQTRLPTVRWRHVPSHENPADCASRGITARELRDHELWWSGPPWLRTSSTTWPSSRMSGTDSTTGETILAEARKGSTCHAQHINEWELPFQFSSWTRLVRITAYLRRFIANLARLAKRIAVTSTLNVSELRDAQNHWFRAVQRAAYAEEIKCLSQGSAIPRTSALRSLNPVLGKDALIRLGGRLANSALSYHEQHPIILPRHKISELLIDYTHKITLHGGAQLMLRTLRQQYWLISARSSVKVHISRCVTCVRERAQHPIQIMGDLPAARVTVSLPFTHTGIDYVGPIQVIPYVGRGQRARKYYIAVFVCMTTKAIHLEYVEDYTTAGFIAALKRFAGRRGCPAHLYSDNGTNFQGADRELRRVFKELSNERDAISALAQEKIQWHFGPPAAPHFGGLWEAAVKSFKHHFRRAVDSHTLSQNELATLLCQIEACLNSRPLTALSDDPNDLSALTPGHFLVERPLVSIPDDSYLESNMSRLSR